MKKRLIATAALFAFALGCVTAFLYIKSENKCTLDTGEYSVTAKEIETLIENGDTEAATRRANELQTALNELSHHDNSNSMFLWVLFGACVIVMLGVFAYVWFKILRPFSKLQNFAERIAGGDFNLPLEYERTNYFGKFTWAFDCMRKEISIARECEKEAIENNKTVIASLSHDIKSPVASIRAYAEGLEAGLDKSPEKRAKYLDVIMRKCDEVAALTNDMLLHSISDLDKLKMNPTRLELCSFVKETVSEISIRDNIQLELPQYPINLNVDKSRLVQVFENIISNASKYAKTDVIVSASADENNATITFRDFGNGVSEEEIPFIFDKFYRGSRIGNENGAGLGLHIVRYIVKQSGGEIFAENLTDGFMIKIILPLS